MSNLQNLLYIGNQSQITCTITDINGNFADPGSVACTIRLPDGTKVTPSVSRFSVGIYQVLYIWTQQYNHYVEFSGTLPFPFTAPQQFYVQPLPF